METVKLIRAQAGRLTRYLVFQEPHTFLIQTDVRLKETAPVFIIRDGQVQEIGPRQRIAKVSSGGRRRYCVKCGRIESMRAKNCAKCGRPVLRRTDGPQQKFTGPVRRKDDCRD